MCSERDLRRLSVVERIKVDGRVARLRDGSG